MMSGLMMTAKFVCSAFVIVLNAFSAFCSVVLCVCFVCVHTLHSKKMTSLYPFWCNNS